MSITYPEIDPADIRKGDLIRWERPDTGITSVQAAEYLAHRDGNSYSSRGTHRLVSRPTPPVVLPTKPTLGFISAVGETSVAVVGISGRHAAFEDRSGHIYIRCGESWGGWDSHDAITAFTPGTAVETAVIDAFRTWWMAANLDGHADADEVIGKFFDDIEDASS